MQLFATLLTAAAFLLHMGLGCCAHHVHAAEGSAHVRDAGAKVHGHLCHGHHGHDHQSPAPGDQSPDHSDSGLPDSDCNHCHCVFLAAGKTVVAKAVFLSAMPLCIAEPASRESVPALVAALDSGGLIPLPVRPHLLNQVQLN
jgi:hypothetical protein